MSQTKNEKKIEEKKQKIK